MCLLRLMLDCPASYAESPELSKLLLLKPALQWDTTDAEIEDPSV